MHRKGLEQCLHVARAQQASAAIVMAIMGMCEKARLSQSCYEEG